MVHFKHISIFEVQSTGCASPLLLFEKFCLLEWQFGMPSHSCCPVTPIAVIRTLVALNLNVCGYGKILSVLPVFSHLLY